MSAIYFQKLWPAGTGSTHQTGELRESLTTVDRDSRRGVCSVKPAQRGWLHLLWFEASLVLGTLMLARARGSAQITATAVDAASVSAMFGSALCTTAAIGPPPGGTAGALSYLWRWPNPRPAVFGYHEVCHAGVCAAATCQYIAIALFIS